MALAMHRRGRKQILTWHMLHVAWQDMKHEGRMSFHCSNDQTAMSQKFMAEMKMGHEYSDLGRHKIQLFSVKTLCLEVRGIYYENNAHECDENRYVKLLIHYENNAHAFL
jgi:hypothetical protein